MRTAKAVQREEKFMSTHQTFARAAILLLFSSTIALGQTTPTPAPPEFLRRANVTAVLGYE
jgi:hypothetical protein